MATCNQCRFHKIDQHGHACSKHSLVYTDYVEGRRECYVLNRDGHCEHFKQSRRVQVMGMLISAAILLIIIGSFVLYEWAETRKPQMILKRQAIELKNEQRAKQPVKVYRGTYDGKPIEIKAYKPMRK